MEIRGSDINVLRRLQVRVGDALEQHLAERTRSGLPRLDAADTERLRDDVTLEVVESYARQQVEDGAQPMSFEEQQHLVRSLRNRLAGVGSLSDLLADDSIEEIDINGWQNTFIDYTDGSRVKAPPLFSSDDELIETIQVLAAHEGLSGRPFDRANPHVNFRLGSARVQAVQAVSTMPAVSIRLHPPTRLFQLKDLVANGTINQPLADFFAAAVRAKKNIIIGGETSSGKTVLLRALAAEISPEERLITIERALELGLHDDPEAHPDVVAMEERIENAEGEGAVPLRELLLISKRMRPDRVIVGEVLGDEILVMLNAMMQGNDGSLSTIHANSSAGIVENICSYAVQAPERLPRAATISMIALGLDFLVFLRRIRGDGEQRRVVTSVREIVGYDSDGLKTNEIFTPGPDGLAERASAVQISCLPALQEAGYRDGQSPQGWV